MASLYNYDLMHHHHQQIPQTAISQYPHFTHTEWLQGWRRWAESRKRGKMAQFIVELLEKGASGHWLDITAGKFELTEWHAIAQFWYKKKKRASDPTDAPCMLRKGLPRAFPNLREVKSDSVKDGTQYKSRVFQCPPELVQEVIQIMSGQGSYQLIHNPLADFNGGVSSDEEEQPTEGWPADEDINDFTTMMLSGPPQQQNGYISPQLAHSEHMFDQQIKKEQQLWNSSYVASPASFGTSPSHSPQYPIPDQQQQPINGHGGIDQWIQQQPITGDVYNSHLTENTLEVPAPLTPASDSRRSSGSLQAGYPNSPQISSPQMISSTSQMVSHSQMMTSSLTQLEQPLERSLMPIKLYPNKSQLEGGGELIVVFTQGFPDGPKTILYVSHQNPSYSYRCDAMQENPMALSVIIPSHPIAEEVDVQVYCSNHLIARAPFTFYQGANYEVAQMLQFINQHMPQFFSPGYNPNTLGGNSSGNQDGFSQGNGNYNYGNPAYMLLVGACKSGIEPLVRALLQIPGVGPLLAAPIPGHDGGINVAELAKQNGHIAISNCIKDLINHSVVTARLPSGDDPIDKLEKGGSTPQQSARCVLHALKAVRDGEDPASAIRKFVKSSTSRLVRGAVVDTDNEIKRLSGDISKIVVSEDANIPKNDAAVTPDASTDSAMVVEIEALKEENEKLKEAFESMKEQNKVKDRECKMLSQERDRLYKKISDLEGELEDNAPGDHIGHLYRAQSDMTIMPKTAMPRGGINLPNKPRLTRQNRSIDPHKNPPLAFTQTWLSKESGISLSMEEEVSNYSGRRRSSLLSLMSERGEGNEITLLYPNDEARTVADSLYFDTMHIITEDWPMTENVKMFKVGERLLEIDGQSLRDKTFDEVLELLKQANSNSEDDGKKKILKQTMPPILATIASDIDLDASKIDSLLIHSPPSARQITLSRTSDELPFKLAGGNAVGLFITEASLDAGILPGDQIMQINGRSTANMTYEEAMAELKLSTQFNLEVVHNHQAWESQRLQRRFELDSAVYKCQSSYSPDKDTASMKDSMKEMELTPGTMVHVINTSLYEESGYWLAWKLSPEGHKVALKKIPSALKAKELYGDVGKLYERISLPIYGQ